MIIILRTSVMDGALGYVRLSYALIRKCAPPPQQPFSPISCLTFGETHFLAWHTFPLSRPRPRSLDSLSTPRPESRKLSKGSYFCAEDKLRSSQIFLAPPSFFQRPLVAARFFILHRLPFARPAAASRNVLYDAD